MARRLELFVSLKPTEIKRYFMLMGIIGQIAVNARELDAIWETAALAAPISGR